jgi:hypothetical protein
MGTLCNYHNFINENFLQEKAVEATKQKEEKRKKLKPEEQEGMPQHIITHAAQVVVCRV